MSDKTVTERDAVLRERMAWARAHVGANIHNYHETGPCAECSRARRLAAEVYPLPKIRRARVVQVGPHEYRVTSFGGLETRVVGMEWQLMLNENHAAPVGNLLANPTELVDDDGSQATP